MKKLTIIFFFILANILGSKPAYATNSDQYLLSQAYFEDKSNSLSISQIEQKEFIPYQGALTGGYKTGTFWLKLKIAASTQPLILKIRPVFIEEIELFDSALPQQKPLVGNKYPLKASDIEAVSYNFELVSRPADRDIYLRIKSVRSYLVNAEVMPLAQYQKKDRQELLVYAAYSTLTLLIALWLLVSWVLHRELVLGIFAAQQIFAFLHTSLHGGIFKILFDDYFDPIRMNSFFSFLVVTYPFFGILANKFLLREYGLKRSFNSVFNLLLFFSALVITLNFLTNQPLTFNLNSLLVFITILFFLIASLFGVDIHQSTLKADALPINVLRIFYIFNLTLWTLAIFPLQGWLPGGELALHSLHIYSMVSGLVFFFLLQYRAKALLKIESSRAIALKSEADHERQQREEQSMLLAMLSHEIKTPLSVLKLVVDEKVSGSDLEGHANRAVNNIDFIIERCLQLGKIDAKSMQVHKITFRIDEFINSIISEFKTKNHTSLTYHDNPIVHTDQDILRIIVSNILENAIKYSPKESQIYIETRNQNVNGASGVQIQFINDVGSMGAPDPEHVFKKYYRNSSATKISGSGLGLYLVYELIQLIGGLVSYQYQHQKVIFKLWIPC
ncbi:sensor histidine kinase [Zwartia vadi]|uniref:sensor histidine kinase n=1 Tax=Zwartia vadi TaxID=3058168 RepID=UPI0025B51363|nr:ATP-binding protein [Zwartia vadi]MDN3987876.1 ATP-binding protein [Zwartia vadi]